MSYIAWLALIVGCMLAIAYFDHNHTHGGGCCA